MSTATLPEGPPIMTAPKGSCLPAHLSPSAIKDYLGCPRRYFFGRVLKLPQPTSPSLHLGKAVHETIRFHNLAVWRGEDASPEVVEAAYGEVFNTLEQADGPVNYKDGDQREKLRLTGKDLVTAYLESEAVVPGERPVGVEVRVKERFTESPLPLLGFVDYVRPGNIPVDYKTVASSPNPEQEAWTHQVQLTAYQLMVERATGESVSGLELVFLVKTKKPRVIRHQMPPADQPQIERFWAMVRAVIDGLSRERFHPHPGMQCSWCPFRGECARWKGGAS